MLANNVYYINLNLLASYMFFITDITAPLLLSVSENMIKGQHSDLVHLESRHNVSLTPSTPTGLSKSSYALVNLVRRQQNQKVLARHWCTKYDVFHMIDNKTRLSVCPDVLGSWWPWTLSDPSPRQKISGLYNLIL